MTKYRIMQLPNGFQPQEIIKYPTGGEAGKFMPFKNYLAEAQGGHYPSLVVKTQEEAMAYIQARIDASERERNKPAEVVVWEGEG